MTTLGRTILATTYADEQSAASARAMAAAYLSDAEAAKLAATALEQQLGIQRQLQTALGATAAVEEEATAAHNRMGGASLIADHVVRSFTDSIIAGQSPVRAFAMELPRVAEAMQFMALQSGETEGVVGKFASFMGGGWGLAITAGVSVLGLLAGKFLDTGDATKAAQKIEEEYGNYQSDLANFIDTANGKLRERLILLADISVQENQGKITAQYDQVTAYRDQGFQAARNTLDRNAPSAGVSSAGTPIASRVTDPDVQKAIDSSGASIIKLRASINALVAGGRTDLKPLADQINDLAGKAAFAKQKADELRGSTNELSAALHGGTVLTKESVDRHVDDATATTALAKAQAHLRDVQAQGDEIAKQPYSAEQQSAFAQYEKDLLAATNAVKKLQDAQRSSRDNRQIGRQISVSDAEDIVHSIGGRVTSATRSTAEQTVLYDRYKAGTGSLAARPGTSDHERGQALDIAKSAGVTLATIRKAFEDAGVHVKQLLDEGNHYHVAWGKAGPTPEQQQHQAAGMDRSFQDQLRQAQDGYARAMLALSDTAQQRYSIAIAQMRADLATRDDALDDQVAQGKISEAHALQLKVIYGETEQLNEQIAKRDELAALLDQQITTARAQLQSDLTLLQLQLQGATTRASQYDLARQILAKQQEDRRDSIAQRINNAAKDPNGAAAAVQEAQNLPAVEAQEKKNQARQYQSPVQAYGQQLNQNVGNMNDALQGVAVDGLKNVEDGLTGLVTGTETVQQAFKRMATSIISDLARIAIEKAIVSFIPGLGLKDGGKVGGFAMGGLPGFAAGMAPSRAGNLIRGPGTGRSDSILALVGGKKPIMISNGEGIVNERAVKDWWPVIDQMNKGTFRRFANGGLPSIPSARSLSSADVRKLSAHRFPTNDAGGLRVDVSPSPYFDVAVTRVAAPMAQAAVIGGAQQAAEDRHDDAYSAIPQ